MRAREREKEGRSRRRRKAVGDIEKAIFVCRCAARATHTRGKRVREPAIVPLSAKRGTSDRPTTDFALVAAQHPREGSPGGTRAEEDRGDSRSPDSRPRGRGTDRTTRRSLARSLAVRREFSAQQILPLGEDLPPFSFYIFLRAPHRDHVATQPCVVVGPRLRENVHARLFDKGEHGGDRGE